MKIKTCFLLYIVMITAASCSVLKESPKYKLQDGFYRTRIENKKAPIYVVNNDTIINIYPASKNKRLFRGDSLPKSTLTLPQQFSTTGVNSRIFNAISFDIDFLTFPFKYRPGIRNIPKQFNTALSGGVYLGRRNDIFKVAYKKSPLKTYERKNDHYGFSYGVFTGVGSTVMNPSTTNGHITYEYDGVVWGKGIAGTIALNSFTVGLAFGFDDLLDRNHGVWNFQHQPWLGLALGLNLN